MSIEWDDKRVDARLKRMSDGAVRSAGKGCEEAADEVIETAEQLVPVDTGALQASSFREPFAAQGTSVEVGLGFDEEYAAAVHEDPDQADRKYLERAFEIHSADIPKVIAKAMLEEWS